MYIIFGIIYIHSATAGGAIVTHITDFLDKYIYIFEHAADPTA